MIPFATIVIMGTAPDSLGCPPIALASEDQLWHAVIVRGGEHQTFATPPGRPLYFVFTVSSADTFAIRVWGENSAGNGCETVVIATSSPSCFCPPALQRRED